MYVSVCKCVFFILLRKVKWDRCPIAKGGGGGVIIHIDYLIIHIDYLKIHIDYLKNTY